MPERLFVLSDMTLTLSAIHQRIEALDDRLMELPEEIERAREAASAAEAAWKSRLAAIRLTERARAQKAGEKQPTQDWLEDLAHRDAALLYSDHLFANSNVETLRDVLKATQTRSDLMRTLAASFRQAGG